jgi:HEPN domain-containing protein
MGQYTKDVAYDFRNWIELGRGELQQAGHAMENGGYHFVAFLAHQAAEQALKGLWLFRGDGIPPRSHNLVELARALEAPDGILDACARLGPHYMASRYPDIAEGNPADNYTAVTAGELLQDGQSVFGWCATEVDQQDPPADGAESRA